MSWRMTEVCEVWLSMQWVTLMKQLGGWQMLAGFTSNDPLCVYQRLRLNLPSRPHRWSWRGPDWLMILMRRSPSGPDPWSWWRRRSCPLTLLPKRSSMVDNHKYCYTLTDRRAWAFKKNNKLYLLVFDAGDKANDSKPPDIYSFDEDSSDALSPQQPASQHSPSSTSTSPRESGRNEATSTSSKINSPIQVQPHLEPLQFIKHVLPISADKLSFLTSYLI